MFVVTLPSSAAAQPRAFALRAKRLGADILEIRGDITPALRKFASPLPLLVSPRGHGHALLETLQPAYVDLDHTEVESTAIPATAKLIVSMHDPLKTPSLIRLKAMASRMQSFHPWMIKIATKVRTLEDLLVLEALHSFLGNSRVTVLGMGDNAHLTRVLSPQRNTLTYACLDPSQASAEGQLPLSFYALTKHIRRPRIFGIIGGLHIARSLSPLIHNALFSRHSIDAVYSSFPSLAWKPAIRTLSALKVKGLSVTAPFKRDAFALASSREHVASSLGVVNTLVRGRIGWKGWNSDWYGIFHGYPALKRARSVAIFGAGGAVPAAIVAARKASPKASITIFARNTRKAERDLKAFHVDILPLSQAATISADVLICAVSKDASFPLPRLHRAGVAIDLRYGKTTMFMRDAKKAGYRVADGVPMLIHQALKQFHHFTGIHSTSHDVRYLKSILKAYG